MITEYTITYWHHGEELTQYFATVCAKDKTEAEKLFGQFYRDCEIIGIRRVVPESRNDQRFKTFLDEFFFIHGFYTSNI